MSEPKLVILYSDSSDPIRIGVGAMAHCALIRADQIRADKVYTYFASHVVLVNASKLCNE
jgi:hypothetical protein